MTSSIAFESIAWQPLSSHAREKQKVISRTRLRILQLDAGFHETTWCCNAHYGYVIDGELQIRFHDHSENLSPGDGIALTGGEQNAHKAIVTKGPVTLFLVEPVTNT